MEHPLDNPVWHALIGPHATIAIGRGLARQYPHDIAPFSAIAGATATAYADLAAELPPGLEARLFRPTEEPAPLGWETVNSRTIIQMVAEEVAAPKLELQRALIELCATDQHDMLQLAGIARPGPFGPRTHMLGAYVGCRNHGELVAMGGERLRVSGCVELSAICVRAEARGKGFGAAITQHLARSALARGETPFLHVFPENPAAALYQRLGFRERARLWVIWRRFKGTRG
jgi:ribosomal protein S18 acetylase RimI-like enzyme